MENVSTPGKQSYCRKTRFYPTPDLKTLLQKCFHGTRYLTNQALEHIRDGKISATTSAINIRNHLRYQDKYLEDDQQWLKEIPYDTRDGAIRQLASNFKSAFTHLKKGLISKFEMKFKSRKAPKQVCYVNKTAFTKGVFFPRRVKYKAKLKFKDDISKYADHGTLTIVYEKGKYYTCFPLTREYQNLDTPYTAVALDPGVKTFQSFYSEEGLVGKFGDRTFEHLKGLYHLEDTLKSALVSRKLARKTKRNIKNRCCSLRTKVKNVVDDLHRKTCNWLTSTFKYIFLPSFNVKPMVCKDGRVIGKSTARAMLSLSHFSFKQRLLHMGQSRGCEVNICSEAYTSKTCGCCGAQKNDLGGSREYTCTTCGLEIDRDYNGARNIYLRNTQYGYGSTH